MGCVMYAAQLICYEGVINRGVQACVKVKAKCNRLNKLATISMETELVTELVNACIALQSQFKVRS